GVAGLEPGREAGAGVVGEQLGQHGIEPAAGGLVGNGGLAGSVGCLGHQGGFGWGSGGRSQSPDRPLGYHRPFRFPPACAPRWPNAPVSSPPPRCDWWPCSCSWPCSPPAVAATARRTPTKAGPSPSSTRRATTT